MPNLPPERAIAEIDELLRTMPSVDEFPWPAKYPDSLHWTGRFVAVMSAVSLAKGVNAESIATGLRGEYSVFDHRAKAVALLHEARYASVLVMPAPMSTQIGAKAPFDYFDEVRKIISTATGDLLFVDPYLDASFISRYMPHVASGVRVRLLGSNAIAALASSASAFASQESIAIEVRKSTAAMHDRFVFVDAARCYQSGASFKDGGVKAPATIVQIVDAFPAVQSTYEALWASGTL